MKKKKKNHSVINLCKMAYIYPFLPINKYCIYKLKVRSYYFQIQSKAQRKTEVKKSSKYIKSKIFLRLRYTRQRKRHKVFRASIEKMFSLFIVVYVWYVCGTRKMNANPLNERKSNACSSHVYLERTCQPNGSLMYIYRIMYVGYIHRVMRAYHIFFSSTK